MKNIRTRSVGSRGARCGVVDGHIDRRGGGGRGSVGFEQNLGPFSDIGGVTGSGSCNSVLGSSFPVQIFALEAKKGEGLGICLGQVWLPGLTPGAGGHGFPFSVSYDPNTGHRWTMHWSAPVGEPALPAIGNPSPITTGLLTSPSGALLGTATAVWQPNSCQSDPPFFVGTDLASMVMEFKTPS